MVYYIQYVLHPIRTKGISYGKSWAAISTRLRNNSPARHRALLHCNDEVLPVNALIGWPEDPKLHPHPLRETPQALRVRTLVMLAGDRDLKGGQELHRLTG